MSAETVTQAVTDARTETKTGTDELDRYVVVRNREEQYSIWRDGRVVPAGWVTVGSPAPKAACLARIEELWTDLRPLSLRRAHQAAAAGAAPTAGAPTQAAGS